jgi:hypothetical protein
VGLARIGQAVKTSQPIFQRFMTLTKKTEVTQIFTTVLSATAWLLADVSISLPASSQRKDSKGQERQPTLDSTSPLHFLLIQNAHIENSVPTAGKVWRSAELGCCSRWLELMQGSSQFSEAFH